MNRWRVGFAILLIVQFWALYVPRAPSLDTELPVDKVVHFTLFAVVTWFGVRAGIPGIWVVCLMMGQALASEAVQHFWLPQRGGDPWDLAADVAGITAGWWVARERSHSPGTATPAP